MFILLPFRPVTKGRLRRARLFSVVIFFSALALYAFFAIDYAFPGQSAALMTFVSGLDVVEVPAHPLLRLLGRWVASLSFASLPLRFNLCSSVAGALILAWLYKIIWFFVFEHMREESAVTHAARLSRFAAICVVLSVGLSLPFLYAATRFNAAIFESALIVGLVQLLCVYGRSRKVQWLLLFGLLSGVGVAESPLVIAAAPILLYLALVVEWKQSWYRITRLSLAAFVAAGAFTLTHWISARAFVMAGGAEPTRTVVINTVISVFKEQLFFLTALLPRLSWFFALGFGAGYALITVLTVMRLIDNRRAWVLLFTTLLLSALAVVTLFNLPPSLWTIYTGYGVVPVLSSLLACTAIGLLIASWRAQATLQDPREGTRGNLDDYDDGYIVLSGAKQELNLSSYRALRVAGAYLGPLLLLLVCVSGVLNFRALLRDDGSFMERAARHLVTALGERRFVLSNGLMDNHLLIAAQQLRKEVYLLAPYRARDSRYCKSLLTLIEHDPAFTGKEREWGATLLNYNLYLFINDFFASQREITKLAVCMGLPDIWYDSKKTPVPELLFYGGAADSALIDIHALLAQHGDYFDLQKAFFNRPQDRFSKLTWGYRGALLRHLAFVANNLGVTLDEREMPEAAFQVYTQAREIYPDNISALLNQFELVLKGLHPEKRDLIEKQVGEKVSKTVDQYPLWALNRHFGYVRNYELFVGMGWDWAISSSPGSVLAGLRRTYAVETDPTRRGSLAGVMAAVYEMQGDLKQSRDFYTQLITENPRDMQAISGLVRLALQGGGVDDARLVLERGQQSGVPAQALRKDWAALYLMAGDLSQARALLQAEKEEHEENIVVTAMLAMVMIEQGDLAGVEAKILPELIKMEKNADNYFAHVIQGRVFQMKGKLHFPRARKHFMRAFNLRPDVRALQDIIFRLDLALEDRAAAEARAIELLRASPAHPMANFFMGSVALEAGEYGVAEGYLKRSAQAQHPTVEALNNYAQLLCRIKRSTEAVKIARQAVVLAPERYETWSTLAYVLLDANELEEAATALGKAFKLNESDKRLFITDGLIALKRGDLAGVKKAVAAVGTEAAALPEVTRRDLQILYKAMEAQ
ncbi:MAG: hypothetical protein PHO37_18155 [Kiritimatiellae bacterium]|nr:hypothetical protein [Kiritimatiellia bacterium]